jgi:hypothetical protein
MGTDDHLPENCTKENIKKLGGVFFTNFFIAISRLPKDYQGRTPFQLGDLAFSKNNPMSDAACGISAELSFGGAGPCAKIVFLPQLLRC